MSQNQSRVGKREREVCVFGSGPAALAVASRLTERGRDVMILDCPPAAKAWGGETFTGAIRGPLSALGAWETFEQAGHRRGFERDCAWGGEPQTESSIVQPLGPLWHVDRSRFDDDLRMTVLRRVGDVLVPYQKLNAVNRDGEGWQVAIDGGTVRAKFLVDATGRGRVLARRLNAKIVVHDSLLGLTSEVWRGETHVDIRSMLMEATPFGWWYAAPTPKGHVLAFFTDSDLAPADLRRRLRPVAANSVFTQIDIEQPWLPVGDACASHDPLCGWGVHRAMSNGLLAGDAIDAFLVKRDSSGIVDYRDHCSRQYETYLAGLTQRYRLEQRWPTAPFWQRRQQIAAELSSSLFTVPYEKPGGVLSAAAFA